MARRHASAPISLWSAYTPAVPVSGTVWLVGMMGAGKSTVGPALARCMGRRFVDLDEEVERHARAAIVDIFEREGEAGFRGRERRAIERWSGAEVVMALGGGAIAQPGVATRLQETGVVVYLRAQIDTLQQRLGRGATRPLLRDLSAVERRARLEALQAEREPAYERAGVTVDVDHGSVECIARRALVALQEVGA